MLVTAPSFLFLFLPAIMGIYALIPAAYRRYAILVFNLAYYVIAAWAEPIDLLLILLAAGFTYSAGFLIAVTHRRSTLLAAIAVDVAAFVIFRLFYDYTSPSAALPFGVTVYLLASISYLLDIYRADAPHAKNIGDLLTYMLFFPTLILGPILRYKDFGAMLDKIDFNLTNFAEGVKLFLGGFFKRIAIAAPLAFMLARIGELERGHISIPVVLIALLMLCAQAYFTLSGYSDIARGLMYMLGIPHAPDFQLLAFEKSQANFSRSFFGSLNRWVEDYLLYPVLRRSTLSPRIRRLLAVTLSCVVPALLLKSRWYMLLPVLPMVVLRQINRASVGATAKLGKIGYRVVFALCYGWFWLAAAMPDAEAGITFLREIFTSPTFSVSYTFYAVMAYLPYLAVGGLGLACLIPLSADIEPRIAALPRPVGIAIRTPALIGTMIAFAFTILHLLPQFPQYATTAFCHIVF